MELVVGLDFGSEIVVHEEDPADREIVLDFEEFAGLGIDFDLGEIVHDPVVVAVHFDLEGTVGDPVIVQGPVVD